jgi:hypothetical protein
MADRTKIDELNGSEILKTDQNANLSHSGAGFFEIRVKGQLNSHWSEWLEGLEVRALENGDTILFGQIVDQAALMGVLNKLSRLNLAILSVNEVKRAY